jgi:hypothetical protein
VHVSRSDGLTGAHPATLAQQRALVESLGGSYHQVVGDDVPRALLDFARAENATQLVLGASRRGRLAQLLTPGIGVTTTKLSGSIDVHLVTHEHVRTGRGRLPRISGGLTLRRRLAGAALAAVLLPLLTLVLTQLRGSLDLSNDILLFLLAVVAVALVGGLWPATAAAIVGSLLLNYYFVSPIHTFTIAERNNALALLVFLTVAAMVSAVVDLAARRTSEAARASAEAETLSTLAGDVLRGDAALPALLDRIRQTFGLTSVALLERGPEAAADGGQRRFGWRSAHRHGPTEPPADPARPRGWHLVAASGADPAGVPRTATPSCRSATTWHWCFAAGRCRPRTAGCWPRSAFRPRWHCSSGWSRPPPRPSRWPKPIAPGPRCSPRSATTCARRWPRRRPRSPRCAATTCRGARRSRPSCWPPPKNRWTG